MSNLFWLTDEQMTRLKPFSPKSHGHPRVDDRRVLSGIIFVSRNGSRWCDVPKEYGRSAQDPLQSLEAMERDGRLRPDLRGAGVGRSRANAHHDQRDRPEGAPHSVEPSGEKRGRGRLIGRTRGGMNTRLHAVTDTRGRPIKFFMSAGQVSDYTGAAALVGALTAGE